jgi:hypothetical protein
MEKKLDPNGPGVVTLTITCGCGASTPLSVFVGGPPPIAGTYELTGECSGCEKAVRRTIHVSTTGSIGTG